ncbi:hypothetical protein CLOM_g7985 [Closterium sp. NIES-68]|nr:hypothetical protein CLOM_g7985 [Closterium sp. NIES-68]
MAPLLHTLSLASSAVSDADVAACVSSLARMQVLVLDNCRKLTDAVASPLASSPSLSTISLHRCFGLTPRTVFLLLEASRKEGSLLTALLFSHVDRLSVRHVAPPQPLAPSPPTPAAAAEAAADNTSLAADTTSPSAAQSEPSEEDGLMAFLGLTQKKEEEDSFPAAVSRALHRPSSLRSLSLHSCQALSGKALQLIALTCPSLEVLCLGGSSFPLLPDALSLPSLSRLLLSLPPHTAPPSLLSRLASASPLPRAADAAAAVGGAAAQTAAATPAASTPAVAFAPAAADAAAAAAAAAAAGNRGGTDRFAGWGEGEVRGQVRPGEVLGWLAVLLGRLRLVEVSFWGRGVMDDIR